jgi:hypothetical protein
MYKSRLLITSSLLFYVAVLSAVCMPRRGTTKHEIVVFGKVS